MRFISKVNPKKENPKKIEDKSKWFDNNFSSKLNIPKNGTFNVSRDFGQKNFDIKYSSLYTYKNKTKLFKKHEFVPEIKQSDAKKLKGLKTQIDKIEKEFKTKKIDEKTETNLKSLKTKRKNLENISKNLTLTTGIKINPSSKQIKIFKKWYDESEKCYNKCVDEYNKNNDFFKDGYKKAKLEIFKLLYKKDEGKGAPYDVLTDEVRKFCSNLKSCDSNLEKKHIKKFEMKHINRYKSTSTIFIPKSAIKNGCIYKTHLEKMKGLEKIKNVDRDCTLTYNKRKNKYFLNIPKTVERKTIKNRESICAIDEGEVSFVTFHAENSFGHLGLDMRKMYLKKLGEISRIQRILKKGKNKKGGKLKNKTKLRKSIQKKYEKLTNISKEFRNKISLFLVRKFDKIILPKFESQQMLREKKCTKAYFNKLEEEKGKVEMKKELKNVTKRKRFNRKIRFSLNMQSHFKFKEHLKHKADEYCCTLITDADENETTKTCTNCGSMRNEKYKRIRECLCCGLKMDRDISASRNTLIKNVSKEELN